MNVLRSLTLVLLLGSALAPAGAMAAPPTDAAPPSVAPAGTRLAVLVGANSAAPGRRALLYSHRDAERMAEVLSSVGGFRREDVILLKDPSPQAVMGVLMTISQKLAGSRESLLYFYYSGHADETALYPRGEALPLARVRALIDEARAAVKIGVVDACRGGSWTRTKGLVVEDPFAVRWPLSLDNEGSVLIASSSGIENAHESDRLQGSFFSYHFTGGLRGAADRNSDGLVSLSEAFDYAKELTIRDTLRYTRETQRPSYAVNLRGRQDLVLARLAASTSSLAVQQDEGPLELVHASSGLQLLELPAGPRRVKLAVPPGLYLVRKRTGETNLVREVTVTAGVQSLITEADLTLVGQEGLAVKGEPEPRPARPLFIVSEIDRQPAIAGAVTLPALAPPSVRPDRPWSRWGAIGLGTVAVLSGAASVKFALDSRHYDRELDQYRRFNCAPPMAVLCNSSNQPLPPLTTDQVAHRDELASIGRRFERMQRWALATAAVTSALSGYLFYRWLRD